MGMSTFGTFTMARLGIYVSQQALNVTGNNISNINTDGYSRQSLEQKAMSFGGADRYISQLVVRENGGVLATGVNQLRDQYLDIRYRNEMTKAGEMEAKLKGLNDLADIFDEVGRAEGDGVLEARFNDLIQQLENLSQPQNIGDDGSDGLVQKSAEKLAIQFNDYAKSLEQLEEGLKAQFNDEVDGVNTILTKIRDLNTSIRKSDIFGSNALTQRDERNLLIDELSEKIGINVTYEMEQVSDGREIEKLVISTAGEPNSYTLIDGIYGAQLSIRDETNFDLDISELTNAKGVADPSAPNELTKTYSVKTFGERYSDWLAVKDQVTKLTFTATETKSADDLAKEYENRLNEYFSAEYGTVPYYHVDKSPDDDGTYVVHYHYDADNVASVYSFAQVTEAEATQVGDTELSGALQAMRELLTEEGEYADADDLLRDKEAGTKRGIPYYRQALDTLARTFAEAMNKANTLDDVTIYEASGVRAKYFDESNQEITDPASYASAKTVKYYEDDALTKETDDPNKYTIFELDSKNNKILKDEYSYYNGGALFTNKGDSSGTTENITAANISVAYGWTHGTTRVLRSKEPQELSQTTKQENVAHIIHVLTSDQTFTFGTANEGTTKFTGTFQEMLTDTIAGTLAKDQSITEAMLNNYNATADELYINRDAVMGVDLNDEAMNMMMFQKAYSAACRLMTTYDGMLDRLINGTAV